MRSYRPFSRLIAHREPVVNVGVAQNASAQNVSDGCGPYCSLSLAEAPVAPVDIGRTHDAPRALKATISTGGGGAVVGDKGGGMLRPAFGVGCKGNVVAGVVVGATGPNDGCQCTCSFCRCIRVVKP